jgi:hypothetical protein
MADTFRADDIHPEVRAHMDRAERWYEQHPGEATPREWYERPAEPERAPSAREPDAPTQHEVPARTTRTRSR